MKEKLKNGFIYLIYIAIIVFIINQLLTIFSQPILKEYSINRRTNYIADVIEAVNNYDPEKD